MHLFYNLESFPKINASIGVTIGNFDGVHKGHILILQHMRELVKTDGKVCVITFSNHSSHILKPTQPTPLLCTMSHKIKLFEQLGVDHLFMIPFTPDLAEQSATTFIDSLKTTLYFSHLVLGHDAKLGKDRQGNREIIQKLAQQKQFEVHYLEAYQHKEIPVSSSLIRQLIQQGNLEEAQTLLGRPYSICSQVTTGIGKGQQIGFPTANIDVNGICLPPYGVYVVTLIDEGFAFPGVANLGLAPTIKTSSFPTLEVHLFSHNQNFYGKQVEVVFHQFLRPEKKFSSIEELKKQIHIDVETARACLKNISAKRVEGSQAVSACT